MKAALLASLLVAASAASAGVNVAAELSRRRVAIDDQLALTVTVSGDQASLPEPQLPPMADFSVYESGRSQNIGFVNGQVSASTTYTYVLQPRALGRLRVPPIRAPGAARPTPPMDVEVVKAGAAPPAQAAEPDSAPGAAAARRSRRPDVFLTASLDKPRVYVNQQVTLTVRFYSAAMLAGDSRYDAPSLTGFLSENLPPVRNGQTVVDGRPYRYSEIKTALFPVKAGRLEIGPAAVHCAVALSAEPEGGDFFSRFFSMAQPRALTVRSDPLTLRVEPLPPGAPADFTGVVGRLSAEAELDRTRLKAGEAANLVVTVSGIGDLKSIPDLRAPKVPALRFFTTQSSDATDKTGDQVGGKKTFRTVVVPRASGDIEVPPISFSYFDPKSKAYLRAQTKALALHAEPAAPGQAAAATAAAPSGPGPGLGLIQEDVRYLKVRPDVMPFSSALGGFAGLGPWHATPFALLFLAALVAWRRRRISLDPRGRRFRNALDNAEKRLAEAAALPPDQAATRLDEALAAFAADKLDVPAAGLTLKSVLAGLRALRHPPSEEALKRLAAAWEEADRRRFAPGAAGDVAAFVSEMGAVIKTLDAEIRP